MCMTVVKGRHKRVMPGVKVFLPVVLEKDLPVFKLLRVGAATSPEPYYMSPIMRYLYSMDVVMEERDVGALWEVEGVGCEVSAGLHAYTNEGNAILVTGGYVNLDYESLAVFKATIPKGSRVYFGRNDTIVSDQLIVHSKEKVVS